MDHHCYILGNEFTDYNLDTIHSDVDEATGQRRYHKHKLFFKVMLIKEIAFFE